MYRLIGMIALPVLASSLALAAAPSAEAQLSSTRSAGDLCWIDLARGRGHSLLNAYTAQGLAGHYELVVRQAGAGNDAVVDQSGTFQPNQVAPSNISRVVLANPTRGRSTQGIVAVAGGFQPGTTSRQSAYGPVSLPASPYSYNAYLRVFDTRGRLVCQASNDWL